MQTTLSQAGLPVAIDGTDLSRACPACGRTTGHLLRFKTNGCGILQCRSCGLGRTETSGFDPAAYYTEDYFSGGHADGYADYLGAEPVLRREFARSVDFIRRYRSNGRLLELGCAYGFFLKEAARYFEVAGIELAGEAAEHGRRAGRWDQDRRARRTCGRSVMRRSSCCSMVSSIGRIRARRSTYAASTSIPVGSS